MKVIGMTLAFSAIVGLSLAIEAPQVPQIEPVQEPTRALRSEARVTPGNVVDGTDATINIGQAIVPAVIGSQGKKDCHQLACWIAAPTEACGMTAANQVQRELMRGRNSFGVESTNAQGMWVRYWRTQFWPPDNGVIADGTCSDGTKFTVTNCQGTGKVYC